MSSFEDLQKCKTFATNATASNSINSPNYTTDYNTAFLKTATYNTTFLKTTIYTTTTCNTTTNKTTTNYTTRTSTRPARAGQINMDTFTHYGSLLP